MTATQQFPQIRKVTVEQPYTGQLVKVEEADGQYGAQYRMTFETPDGDHVTIYENIDKIQRQTDRMGTNIQDLLGQTLTLSRTPMPGDANKGKAYLNLSTSRGTAAIARPMSQPVANKYSTLRQNMVTRPAAEVQRIGGDEFDVIERTNDAPPQIDATEGKRRAINDAHAEALQGVLKDYFNGVAIYDLDAPFAAVAAAMAATRLIAWQKANVA